MTAVLVGILVILGPLVVQGLAVALAVETIAVLLARRIVGTDVWRNGVATVVLIVILLAGHLAQMARWTIASVGAGEFDSFALAFYHSAVNYTTLGYGDIVMSPRWRLLGPRPRSESAHGAASRARR
jgi:Ion channel